jgi:hypothetical protein
VQSDARSNVAISKHVADAKKIDAILVSAPGFVVDIIREAIGETISCGIQDPGSHACTSP